MSGQSSGLYANNIGKFFESMISKEGQYDINLKD